MFGDADVKKMTVMHHKLISGFKMSWCSPMNVIIQKFLATIGSLILMVWLVIRL